MFKFLFSIFFVFSSYSVLAETISFTSSINPNISNEKINVFNRLSTNELNTSFASSSDLNSPIYITPNSFVLFDFQTVSWMFKNNNDLFIRLNADILDKNKKKISREDLTIHCPIVQINFRKHETERHIWSDIVNKKYIFQGKLYSDLFKPDLSIAPHLDSTNPLALLQVSLESICLEIAAIESNRGLSKATDDFEKRVIDNLWEDTKKEK